MSINYDEIISSSLFEFVVGPNQKKLAIHAALATHHSAPLGALIQGPMREAQDRVAELDDLDEQTFVRFCEYAYTGNYTSAQHAILLDSSMIDKEVPLEQPAASEASPFIDTSLKRKDKKNIRASSRGLEPCEYCGHDPSEVSSRKQILWDEFRRTYYCNPPFNSTSKHEPRKNVEECEDYTDVFLCHARVYVFAEKYDIAGLRSLALHKLQQTLQVFHIYDKRIGDIVSLVRFTYNNNNTGDSGPGQDIDRLRKLIIYYVVCVFGTVAKDERFLVLIEEGGPFTRDLASMLLRRIT